MTILLILILLAILLCSETGQALLGFLIVAGICLAGLAGAVIGFITLYNIVN